MANILVIDSDPLFRNQLIEYLSQYSYDVDFAADLSEISLSSNLRPADLVVIDVNRQHDNSLGFLQDLCSTADIPVIVMSADLLAESDKVTALELGASDYIEKPFGLREFLARIRVALRDRASRRANPQHMVYTFDHWRLSTRHRWLKDANGEEIKLTAAELNLLIAFLQSPRQTLSREQLLLATRVHDQEIFDRSVDVLILRLRRKLEEDASTPRYIKTERRAGYVFDADVGTELLRMRMA
ncbi:winged helix-turn-helix domain-containing protein [Rhizobium sp. BT-226]|uniref:winged helix-turn-helix domain-containing protein n=1 Tax=Rhizobium sp. BT-226 TaxID=2986922 RepID=UPI0021F6DE52|nr:winged helix-turn-helix domain-containing protein [Rhizobium sp. BT-226]MCW0021352.1 winged helix-turn-helix domain-containing protein [Rhizobium sp. BT-226]